MHHSKHEHASMSDTMYRGWPLSILFLFCVTGSSVSESATGAKEVVIQGDVMFELPALLMSEFKVWITILVKYLCVLFFILANCSLACTCSANNVLYTFYLATNRLLRVQYSSWTRVEVLWGLSHNSSFLKIEIWSTIKQLDSGIVLRNSYFLFAR